MAYTNQELYERYRNQLEALEQEASVVFNELEVWFFNAQANNEYLDTIELRNEYQKRRDEIRSAIARNKSMLEQWFVQQQMQVLPYTNTDSESE